MLIKIFTDGASFNNGYKNEDLPQYAAGSMIVTLNDEVIKKKTYDYGDNTISYAELQTVLYALQYTKRKYENGLKRNLFNDKNKISFHIYSDSQYVVKSYNEYSKKWLENNFILSSGKTVAYKDIWKEILSFQQETRYEIELIHIRGHQTDKSFLSEMNNLADQEATSVIQEFKRRNGFK